MNKLFAISLATAVSAAILAVPATSQIVVTPSVPVEQAVKKVSRDFDRQINRIADRSNVHTGNGIAIVRFERDEEGDPANARIYRASGDKRIDRVSVRAVSGLRSLDTFPTALGEDQVFQANIIFADNRRSMEELTQELAALEEARLARGPEEREVIALGTYLANTTAQ
ncbi:energy transducer TonB [Qipengyuania gelatinilytica]|uniref:TonB family protein n=1 Tax=Qipengyuania gelatinilytica TaxID=2867231 RepID=A0ABX8ZY34_9SPHN|nr:hypothetical protein [Qipengyuania gelatinilytica]QZD93935.1 hypothetical protein K3136_07360 [Qipengyuania gelatinilytica]